MTPILRNRHEKVQEATINLIGRIGEYVHFMHILLYSLSSSADRGAEFVPAREWMRI